jgi:hypothetical protein
MSPFVCDAATRRQASGRAQMLWTDGPQGFDGCDAGAFRNGKLITAVTDSAVGRVMMFASPENRFDSHPWNSPANA